MLLISLLLPVAMAKPRKNTPPTPPPLRESEPAETQATTPPPLGGQADSNTVFTALVDGVLREEVMEQYLPGAIAGEMPVAFEVEALKAQAVAARTYILYRMAHTNSKHPEADVCGDSGCCKAYVNEETLREKWGDAFEDNWEKMKNAVLETDGQYLSYGGEAIVAVFHSSSASRTEDSENLWLPMPYLVSVDSPETAGDVPNFVTTVEVSAEDFKSTILMLHPDAYFDGAPVLWLGEAKYYESGRVESVKIGGILVPGS